MMNELLSNIGGVGFALIVIVALLSVMFGLAFAVQKSKQ